MRFVRLTRVSMPSATTIRIMPPPSAGLGCSPVWIHAAIRETHGKTRMLRLAVPAESRDSRMLHSHQPAPPARHPT